jgi:hypothetical protein
MKPACSSPGVGLNQHPLRTSARRTILKTRHEIACQKSQGRPSQMKEGAVSEPVHITGQATVVLTDDNRNRKRSRAPCSVGLNQHVLGLAPGCDVRNGRNDETEPKPREAGRTSAARHPAEGKEFWRRRASARNPAPLADGSGKRKIFSSGRPSRRRLFAYPAMLPEATARAEKDRLITAFTSSPESVTSPACAERHRCATLRPERILFAFLHRSSPSLFVEPGIDLRHQDRPKGKFPDFRFPRQSAQVAAS